MSTQNVKPAPQLTEEERRLLISNYFKVNHVELPSFTKGRILLVYIAVFLGLLLIFYLKNAVPTVIFSSACFVFAFWQFYQFIQPYFQLRRLYAQRPTADEMCTWLVKDLKDTVKPKSIQALSLNMSDVRPENFIIIPIPVYWAAPGINADEVLRSPLDDGSFLYSVWRVQILVLTKHFISLFKCNYNWLTNSMSGVSTNEFYFADITSIRNDMREIEFSFVDNPDQPVGAGRVFCVTNNSGEYLTVINDIPSLQGPKNVSVNLEYMVSLLRMVIRNRRFGITHEEVSKTEQQQVVDNDPNTEENRAKNAEEINSIETLYGGNHASDDNDDSQLPSQFDDMQPSSFDEVDLGGPDS
ncbi:MAG: hypothetical protein MJZ61_00055 [Bacteroidales bacterium]|nr:hypothetical protein [Bacteroidales bacterium]